MEVNELADIQQASIDDPRTTIIGRLLRRTNIDELPQFFNVFMGNMSVIGPRPHMLKHTEEYSQVIDQFLIRHYVKPGISGWAQVNGLRGETNELWKMEKRFEYDLEYIKNWTFWWDIQIMWFTLFDLRSIAKVKVGKKNSSILAIHRK
jgi:lipopolysaccharide/colanic/teichoic acid biosynthesis glycosyltransferase